MVDNATTLSANITETEKELEAVKAKIVVIEGGGDDLAREHGYSTRIAALENLRAEKLALQNKEVALQNEKVELLRKENLLRQQQQQQGGAGGTMALLEQQQQQQSGADLRTRFIQLLKQGRIDRPNAGILDLIERRFSSQLLAISNANNALCLYEDAQLLPGSSTSHILLEQHRLRLNGPFSNQLPACILTGTSEGGKPCIVKLLRSNLAPSTSYSSEASICEELQLAVAKSAGMPLVDAKLITLNLTGNDGRTTRRGPGTYEALVMPQYCRVVSDLPQLEQEVIAEGAARLVQAVEYMHAKELVHMDIKGANVFVDADGRWFLGDFGASVHVGDPVHSYTRWFHKDNLDGVPAVKSFDWYMLAVMLAAEIHKVHWKEQLFEGDRVSDTKLVAAAAAATVPELKDLLFMSMQRGQVVGVYPANDT